MSGGGCRGARGIEIAKRRALFGQSCEQRSRRPPRAKLAVKHRDAIENLRQTDLVRTKHGPAAIRGETVTGEGDALDVAGAKSDPVLQNPRPLVDHAID